MGEMMDLLFEHRLLVSILVVFPAIFVSATAIYNIYFHPLAKFPGPKLWSAFRFPYLVAMHSGHLHRRMKEFHDLYGPIVRLAPNELSFTDSRAWRDVYGSRPGHSVFEKNRVWLRKIKPDDPWSIMGHDEDAHARLRKVFVQAFSEKALREQAPVVEGYVNSMVAQFERMISQDGKAVVDLVHWFDFVMFDISGDLSFGESFDCIKNGRAHPWVKISSDFGKGVALMTSASFYPGFDKLLKLIIPKGIRQKMLDHRAMTNEKVRQRLAVNDNRSDWMTAAVKDYHEREDGLTVPEIEVNMTILIFAGSETTSSALSAIMRLLLQHDDPMARAVKEVRTSFDNGSQITIDSTSSLEYLNAVINEGIRLAPPVALGVPRLSPPGGETVCEHYIPGGTFVALNQFAAFRSSRNFERAAEFVPERFLRSSAKASSDDLSVFTPFQLGRHSCIGQRLALQEIRLVLASLLYNFDIKLADAGDIWDWGDQETFIFWAKRPLGVVMKIAR